MKKQYMYVYPERKSGVASSVVLFDDDDETAIEEASSFLEGGLCADNSIILIEINDKGPVSNADTVRFVAYITASTKRVVVVKSV